ncbi:glucose-1-phosphate adenylyltransferase [Spirochaeta africana]|uniref:ADP-glucose pyrophosphorylase n=1 Tax=Spirochaeta africana (strain ATCC 700263 / DSM 8902 / Z-7692) TaxID=889378 RepID=H9UH88_SPIAZ|nr:glucose-1-phosphate adenylyltransferase [Spirochaeta africana]AFG36881.1 ADP-glucose pyrophosphorylase [Spirochaeta africana DSM 8902]
MRRRVDPGSNDVLSIILGGGKGSRLYPLTKDRAKPAVPFGGKYRLVDIPISNSINSDFKKIYILTQFNSASLHLHLSSTYLFDTFSRGFVEILAAEQTFDHSGWYEGTADAVRKNFQHFRTQNPSHYLILSGDQLYRMDLAEMYRRHLESGAQVTIAGTLVTREQATGLGVIRTDRRGFIDDFVEKPPLRQNIEYMRVHPDLLPSNHLQNERRVYLASMGIYFFNADALETALDNSFTDFGNEIIPQLISRGNVHAYIFGGFWEDIGTIRSFYDTSLNLASINPDFNFYDERMPIYTHRRDLPASKYNSSFMQQTLAADGCIITNANIQNSVIGVRMLIESGAELEGVVCMGADYYETPAERELNRQQGIPDIGIARGCRIRHAIIDKNARIGENCSIGYEREGYEDGDYGYYHVKDGIIVIAKNTVLPPESRI